MMYRNGDKENKYFGSDLNKFVNENCSKQMTTINIDLLIFKRSRNRIRIIESKHTSESMSLSQSEVLRRLSKFVPKGIRKFDIFIVRGDEPYELVEVENVVTNKKYRIINQSDFIDWLEFVVELEEVGKEI